MSKFETEIDRLRRRSKEAFQDQYRSGRKPHEPHLAERYASFPPIPPRERECEEVKESLAEAAARKQALLEREMAGEDISTEKPHHQAARPPSRDEMEREWNALRSRLPKATEREATSIRQRIRELEMYLHSNETTESNEH